MTEISKKNYKKLIKYVNENLVIPILGVDYYNLSKNVYMSDEEITNDIKKKYFDIKFKLGLFQMLTTISITLLLLVIINRV
jgi:hypothetical protein